MASFRRVPIAEDPELGLDAHICGTLKVDAPDPEVPFCAAAVIVAGVVLARRSAPVVEVPIR